MTYLDTRIDELTNEAEQHLLRSSQPHGWLGLVRSMRQGRLAWVFWITWATQVLFIVLGIIWAIKFFNATEVLPAVKYGLSAATALILGTLIKVGLAPHLHAERVLRELKRIEILVLAQRSEKG